MWALPRYLGLCAATVRGVALIAACAAISSAGPAVAQEIAVGASFSNQLSQIGVTMRNGRLIAAPQQFYNRNGTIKSDGADGRKEEMKLTTNGATVAVDYKLTTKAFQVHLNLDRGRELHIVRTPGEGAKFDHLEFHQPAEGKITVKIGANPVKRLLEFESIWHLMSAEPDLGTNDVEPLLRLLKSGLTLTVTARSIEELLFRKATTTFNVDRRLWRDLVEQLGGRTYIEREDAEYRLRELGKITVPYLRNLDPGRLDAEQRYRIRAILRRYATTELEDSPDAVADWLAADPEIWYALAKRSDSSQRTVIRAQLSMLLGEPIQLDAAVEGGELTRQLDTIRAQINAAQAIRN